MPVLKYKTFEEAEEISGILCRVPVLDVETLIKLKNTIREKDKIDLAF